MHWNLWRESGRCVGIGGCRLCFVMGDVRLFNMFDFGKLGTMGTDLE